VGTDYRLLILPGLSPEEKVKKARIVPMGRRKSEQLDVITQEEFKSQIAQLEPDYSEHGDEIWNYLLDPKVQWLRSWKNPESSEQIPPVEIVPKHLRRSRYLHPLPDSLDSFNASELADHIERLSQIISTRHFRMCGLPLASKTEVSLFPDSKIILSNYSGLITPLPLSSSEKLFLQS
jgi:hypothetical protein